MNSLFIMRLSDKPGEVVEHRRINRDTREPETMWIFHVGDKKYTFTAGKRNICWIAELGKYDASKAKEYPPKTGNPGGYPVARLGLIWKKDAHIRVKEFIAG